MNGNMQWRCLRMDGSYLVVCKLGVLELATMIERERWNRAIDRCLILRRAVGNMTRSMHALAAVDEQ